MNNPRIGPTEAAVLNALTKPSTIVEITNRLPAGTIDDPAVYIALRRMQQRALVARESVVAVAADGKRRTVGRYVITGDGARALENYKSEVARLLHPRALGAPA